MEVRLANDAPATFIRRAAAYFIDCLVIGFLWLIAVSIATAVALTVDRDSEASDIAIGMVVLLAGPPIWFFYQWASNSRGVSVGKRKMSLSIRSSSARATPGIGTGLVRTLGQALGAVPLGLAAGKPSAPRL